MPKILITEPCLVNYGDDRGGVDEAGGALVEVPKAVANTLTKKNRALYVNKNDDPTKGNLLTASPELVKAAEAAARAAKAPKPSKAAEGQGGEGGQGSNPGGEGGQA